MALSVQDPVLVWQKVSKALAGANPATAAAFRDLKNYITTQGGNPQLQFIPYTSTQAIVNLGTDLVGGACTLYGWYAKAQRTSGTTAAFESLHDASDNSATTTTQVTRRINLTGQQFAYTDAVGLACATGLVISSAQAVGGSSETASAANSTNGFVIVGA
jgi:hypothetical protein